MPGGGAKAGTDKVRSFVTFLRRWLPLGEVGVEQDPLLLEDKELVVAVTTFISGSGLMLCGLEFVTTSGRRVFWGEESYKCKRSVTKDTFLAYCSGGIELDFPFLTFHWDQNHPTPCAHVPQ